MDWLKRMFAKFGIRVHPAMFNAPDDPSKPERSVHPRHIDDTLTVLRPGLAMYNPDRPPRNPELWDLFKKNDWEMIPAAEPIYEHNQKIALVGQRLGKSWISMNTFSIDSKTVCVETHETAYCEQLDKLGFEVVPISYEKVIPFGGCLHCTTLDIYREGTLEDYFPKQIEGY